MVDLHVKECLSFLVCYGVHDSCVLRTNFFSDISDKPESEISRVPGRTHAGEGEHDAIVLDQPKYLRTADRRQQRAEVV